MLNIDWLKPYKHVLYSIGAIYLSIMNLPRQLRFKYENILIIGLISGPKEPQHDINPFLRPLVSELLRCFDGIEMHVTDEGAMCTIKCVLLCITCDIPAAGRCVVSWDIRQNWVIPSVTNSFQVHLVAIIFQVSIELIGHLVLRRNTELTLKKYVNAKVKVSKAN